jgi:hypothetical protein
MNITSIIKNNGISVAVIKSGEIIITDVQSALDIMVEIRYEASCDRFVINKEAIYRCLHCLKRGCRCGVVQVDIWLGGAIQEGRLGV